MGFDNYFEGFVEHTNTNMFAPLGMERSTFGFTPELTNVAMPYISLEVQDVMHTVSPTSAGGLLSSAYEMARFMHTLIGDGTIDGERLLLQETIAYMMQEHSIMAPSIGYGFGFMRVSLGELETVGHGGNITHYHTEMIFDLETGIGVFVSTNTISGILAASPLAYVIMEVAITEKTGVGPVLQPEPTLDDTDEFVLSEEDLAALAKFEGLYSFGDAGIWELSIIDGILTWDSGSIAFELTPLPDGTFDSLAGNYFFEFVDGVAIATLTVGDEQLPGIRIDSIEEVELNAPEWFSDWVGVFNFVPQVENEVGIIKYLTVDINPFGAPVITAFQLFHAYVGTTEVPLVEYNGYWFFGSMPVRFLVDDDGNKVIDLVGALYIMHLSELDELDVEY
jgi:hypothetical protein